MPHGGSMFGSRFETFWNAGSAALFALEFRRKGREHPVIGCGKLLATWPALPGKNQITERFHFDDHW
jgi:hypothetical protein